jgi:hypothetical protein
MQYSLDNLSMRVWLTNLLGDNMDTVKKNTKYFIDARKEIGLQVNEEKTKYKYNVAVSSP